MRQRTGFQSAKTNEKRIVNSGKDKRDDISMMKNYYLVEIDCINQERFLKSCQRLGIDIFHVEHQKNKWIITIQEEDISKLKKVFYIHYKVIGYKGLHQIKRNIQKSKIFLIGILSSLLALYFLSHLILSVEVIHSSNEIRTLILNELEARQIAKYHFKKSFKELEQIKKEIIKNNQSTIEWMEIENVGMKVKVRVEERKLQNNEIQKEACHIIAKKDGMIKSLSYSKGEALVGRNDYVKKGDILISGIIHKEEEEKNVVCAKGSVQAEVWYKVSLSYPMNYEENKRTGKKRKNIKIQNNKVNTFLLKSRIQTYEEENQFLFEIFGTKIYLTTQYEVIKEMKTYTQEEVMKRLDLLMEEKISSLLQGKAKILSKKVLKKEENNGIMNVEVFVSVLEDISMTQEFQRIKGDEDGDAF